MVALHDTSTIVSARIVKLFIIYYSKVPLIINKYFVSIQNGSAEM